MQLNELPKITDKKLKRVGQGHGSGRGKTAGRGTKGQKARGKVALKFEGGALPLIKRLPFHRGKGRNKVIKAKPLTITVSELNTLPAKSVVDIELLIKHNVVEADAVRTGVKVLSNGDIDKVLTVNVPVTKSAQQKIEKAGGSVQA